MIVQHKSRTAEGKPSFLATPDFDAEPSYFYSRSGAEFWLEMGSAWRDARDFRLNGRGVEE